MSFDSMQKYENCTVHLVWRRPHLSAVSLFVLGDAKVIYRSIFNALPVVSSDFCATLYIIMAVSMWLSSHPKNVILPFLY